MNPHTWSRATLLVVVMAIGPVPVSAQGTACGVTDSDARLDAQRLNYLLSNRDCRFWTELEQGYVRNPDRIGALLPMLKYFTAPSIQKTYC